MADLAGDARESRRAHGPLALLYGLPALSALALATLLLGDVISALESGGHDDSDLHHLFVFDLAWPVFLVATLLTLLTGFVALAAGLLRRDHRLTRFGAVSLGWLVVAVVVVVLAVATGLS